MTGTNHPSYDINSGKPVNRSYIISAAPGSGCGRIAKTLWESGLAGAPKEYFNPLNIQDFYQRWEMQTFSEYIARLKRHRATGNGVFGLRSDFKQLNAARKQCNLTALLPNLKFIYVSRRDSLEQAIAYDFTLQNGFGAVSEGKSVFKPKYDYDRFENACKHLLAEERDWELFFRFNDVEPLHVYYDDFLETPALTLSRIFDFLDIKIGTVYKTRWPENSGLVELRREFMERFRREKQQREIKSTI